MKLFEAEYLRRVAVSGLRRLALRGFQHRLATLSIALALLIELDALSALEPGREQHSDPPPRGLARLQVGPESASLEHVAAFAGTLHVWARSETVDPLLQVEPGTGGEPLEDDDSGGGTTAHIAVEVVSGQSLTFRISPSSEGSGTVELHWIAAPETEATLAAAGEAEGEMRAIVHLHVEGDFEGARDRLEALLEDLAKVDGARTSQQIAEALGRIGFGAYRLQSLRAASRALRSCQEHRERVLPPDHPDLLFAKQNLGVVLHDLGDLEAALELSELVYAARKRLLDPNHPDLLAAAQNLARTCRKRGDLERALELEEHVHGALTALLEPDHPDLLRAELNLALTLKEIGRLDEALGLLEHVHATRKLRLDPGHPLLLNAELNLAETRYQLGQHRSANDLYEHVHEVWEAQLAPDHPRLLAVKLGLAMTRKELGDPAGALELESRVLATWEQQLAPDHPDLLNARANLAVTWKALGDLARALELESGVHAAYERKFPPDHPELLKAKHNLSATLLALGDLAGALDLLEHLHATQEQRLEPDHPRLLRAKANLAAARAELGDLAGALELVEYVHAAQERRLAPDHPDLLDAKDSLAGARLAHHDFAGAYELFEYVHAVREDTLDPEHTDLVRSKSNLATALLHLGDLAGARALDEHVHAVLERRLEPGHPDLVAARQNLAVARGLDGDLAGALELFEQVHARREGMLQPDHSDLLDAQQGIALMRWKLGDFGGAMEATRSLLRGQRARARSLHLESPRVAREAALGELGRLSSIISWMKQGDRKAAARLNSELFLALEGLRLVSTGSSRVAIAASRSPELDRLRRREAAARGALNDWALSPPREASLAEGWREKLVELAVARDRLQRELRVQLAERGILTETSSLQAVTDGLAEDSALVTFFRYRRLFPEDPETGTRPSPVDSLLAFAVTPGGGVRQVDLGPSERFKELALQWRAAVGRPVDSRRGGVAVDPAPGEEAVARILAEELLAPCLSPGGEPLPESVYIIADDFLHLVPFDALVWRNGERLGDVLAVRSEVSIQRLASPPRELPEEGTLVAFGGVDFDAEDVVSPSLRLALATPPAAGSNSRGRRPQRFEELAHSGPEAEHAGEVYSEHRGRAPVVLTGSRASKQALVDMAGEARYLHLATHGWFSSEAFQSALDGLAEGSELRTWPLRAEQVVHGFAPETLCGLALAGANRGRDEVGRVPGLITAEEIAVLELVGCELAVLSACETNVGLRRAGQGILSLQAALHAAGARTAITSLWSVPDDWTGRLMERFYTNLWERGLPKAEALWEAKVYLRDQEKAPVGAWAGWVLTGDPR